MKSEFAEWPCSVARAAGVFGDSWTLLIVRDALYGLTRLDEFQRSLRIARNTLSDRLGKLVDTGIMTKRFYQDNPPRYEYLLTESGAHSVITWASVTVIQGREPSPADRLVSRLSIEYRLSL